MATVTVRNYKMSSNVSFIYNRTMTGRSSISLESDENICVRFSAYRGSIGGFLVLQYSSVVV